MDTGKVNNFRWILIFAFVAALFSTGTHQVAFTTITQVVGYAYQTNEQMLTVLTIIYQFTCLLSVPFASYILDKKGLQLSG